MSTLWRLTRNADRITLEAGIDLNGRPRILGSISVNSVDEEFDFVRIVRAVNNHDALLAACKQAYEKLSRHECPATLHLLKEAITNAEKPDDN